MDFETIPTDTTNWLALSEAILRTGTFASLDNLLDQALDVWLENIEPELRWQVAVDLYTSEQVSVGRAAEIAGLNYFVFEKKLKENQIPFVEADVRNKEEIQSQEKLIHAAFNLPTT